MSSSTCPAPPSCAPSLEAHGGRAGPALLALLCILFVLLPATGLAKGKGLPSSTERAQYCAQKLAECIVDVGPTCSDTYDKAEHVGACMDAGHDECNRSFGGRSRCLTSPRVVQDASHSQAAGTASVVEDRPSTPVTTAPRPAGPVRMAPVQP